MKAENYAYSNADPETRIALHNSERFRNWKYQGAMSVSGLENRKTNLKSR